MRELIKIYKAFYSKVLLALLALTICRVLFYLFNYRYFTNLDWMVWLGGLRFDWMTVSILYLPFALAFMFFHRKQFLAEVLFQISTIIVISVNVLDFEYFKFTFKRTTFDLFTTKGIATDLFNLAPRFIMDYWYLCVIGIFLIWLTLKAYSYSRKSDLPRLKILPLLAFIIPTLLIWLIGFRGGVQYKPLAVIQAGQYSKAANIPLVVNTAFTLVKSFNKEDLELVEYYTNQEELDSLFNPLLSIQYQPKDSAAINNNVVLIILESFSSEYIGALSGKQSYTPFLDSLIDKSLVFENAYANGKKSIEGLPAILSSIPSLMDNSYISGKYGASKIESIASVLGEDGYTSSFYHGGENGTMGFDAFCKIAGVQEYIGIDQYPNKEDHDGHWGIYDEPFLQFVAEDLNTKKKPFFAGIFTLSSHHPYPIPDKYKDVFPKGELPILESVAYADYSLKQFFQSIEREDWFESTLFVFTADHTAQSMSPKYASRTGLYSIPLIFYQKDKISAHRSSDLAQQDDIFPSVIDYLGIEDSIVAFGNSVFNPKRNPFVINYINESYQYMEGDFTLHFDREKAIGLFNYKIDPLLENDLLVEETFIAEKMERKVKAIIQQYQIALINNRLSH